MSKDNGQTRKQPASQDIRRRVYETVGRLLLERLKAETPPAPETLELAADYLAVRPPAGV